MKTAYQITPQTLQAVARLRELQIVRQQAAELKQYGRVSTKSYEAEQAAIEFRNGDVHTLSLPIRKVAEWAKAVAAPLSVKFDPAGAVEFSAKRFGGTSQARFLSLSDADMSQAVVVESHGVEFELVGQPADETELEDLKRKLANIRKTAQASKELGIAREKHAAAWRTIRDAANRVSTAKEYLASHSLAEAVAQAVALRDAKRLLRVGNAELKEFHNLYRRTKPATIKLSAEDAVWMARYKAEYAIAHKKNWNRKRDALAIKMSNLYVDALAAMVSTQWPQFAEELYVYKTSEKFPLREPYVSISDYDISQYGTARRLVRHWPMERLSLSAPYMLARARLLRAQSAKTIN